MMKFPVNMILCLTLFLASCQEADQRLVRPITEEHKKAVSDIVNYKTVCRADGDKLICTKAIRARKEAKGDSWKGKWMFTVRQKDRHLEQGTLLVKADYNPDLRTMYPGSSVDISDIKANEIVYVGFTSLNEGPQGFDIITNDLNRKRNLSDIKVKGNNLSWTLSSGGESQLFTIPMVFKTKAQYHPGIDKLNGTTEFGMNYTYFDKGDLKKTKIKYVKMGDYVWEASRISDYSFKEFTKPGVFNSELPMYFVGVNIDNVKR
jgi:hypothetical protein